MRRATRRQQNDCAHSATSSKRSRLDPARGGRASPVVRNRSLMGPPDVARRKRFLFGLAMALFTAGFSFAVVESAARAYGHMPRYPIIRPEPGVLAPDPVLGWTPIPGKYELGPYTPGAAAIPMTIRPDGARESGGHPDPAHRSMLLVGCSFTMGWAVADNETWGARLQEHRPDLDVINRGA